MAAGSGFATIVAVTGPENPSTLPRYISDFAFRASSASNLVFSGWWQTLEASPNRSLWGIVVVGTTHVGIGAVLMLVQHDGQGLSQQTMRKLPCFFPE